MINDLDRTIEKLLTERGKINRESVDIVFDQPTSEWSSHISRPSLNCWAFELAENTKLRSMEVTVNRTENQKANLRLAPLRYNVSYLVTAWAQAVEDEHRLLWRALGALAGLTHWATDMCVGTLREQPYPLPVTVAQLSERGASLTDLWSVVDNEMRLGFTLVVTLALETDRMAERELVFEKYIGIGQSKVPVTQTMEERDLTLTQKVARTPKENGTAPEAKPKRRRK